MNQVFPVRSVPVVPDRSRGVTAVLGPTNTGKTHYAIERMLGHSSGIFGLPLRLLAREVYNRVVERVGADQVALITGEEKIKPPRPRYWIATVEAMPRDIDVAFVAVDEIQLATSLDRGHVFTERLLNRRGRDETLVVGAETMRRAVEDLLPGVNIVTRPRLSTLTFLGERKLTRLPRRSAIVAFSAEEVYAIAELIRRQRGGAAVVLGALSPRTRNAQVELYQNGDVDYIIATDAIGMGLNLDVDHVAFAGDRKFDGWQYRRLNPSEFGQIAGRAGRYLRDGTFGTTGRCPPFDEDLVEALENHRFDPIVNLQWRNVRLNFETIQTLQTSLDALPEEPRLTRTPIGEDVMILDIAARDDSVVRVSKTRADVQRLWEACQIPDYRKLSPAAHAELVLTVFGHIVRAGRIPDSWFGTQVAALDRIDGDIDALSARIAQVRTWTYIANRGDWLGDPEHWQSVTRQVEDNLSDALHERLTQRFVDRRTSVLMRRLRENAIMEAEVTPTGDVVVEGQHVGQLHGFRFTPDPQASGEAARTLNAAAQKALASEIEARGTRIGEAVDDAFILANDGHIRWLGEAVAKIMADDKVLAPRVQVLSDEQLTGPALAGVQRRLDLWLEQHVKKLLGPLFDMESGEGLDGIARGIAYQIAEALGVLERSRVAEEMKSLDQPARATLRKLGVRFGAYHVYLPQLLKPAPRSLAAQLWALKNTGADPSKGLDEVPHLTASGRTSFKADKDVPKALYRVAGYRVSGERALRVDILERLADLIRPAINYRPGVSVGDPPPGTADRDGFVVTVAMTSLAGCSGEDFASILRSLGYVMDRRAGPAITVPIIPAASTAPVVPSAAAAVAESSPDAVVEAEPAAEHNADEAAPHATLVETDASAEPAGQPAFEASDASEPPAAGHLPAVGEPEHGEPEISESAHGELAHGESAHGESAHGEPAASEPAHGEPAHGGHALGEEVHAVEVAADETLAPTYIQALTAAVAETAAATDPEPRPASEHHVEVSAPEASSRTVEEPAHAEPPHAAPAPIEAVTAAIAEAAMAPPAEAVAVVEAVEPHAADANVDAGGLEAEGVPPEEAATDTAAPSSAPEETVEEVLIEVWRPHRHHHHAPAAKRPDRRPSRDQRGGPRQRGPAPGTPADAPQPSAEVPAVAAEPSMAADAAAPGRPQQGRGGQRRDGPSRDHQRGEPGRSGGAGGNRGRSRPDVRPPQDGRPQDGRPLEGRPEDRRHDRGGRPDQQRGGGGPFKPPRERAPDPDSPFAKLASLKADLERKAKGSGEGGGHDKKE